MGHLVGYVDISYADLVDKLGEPTSDGDGYKTDAEWRLDLPSGPASIYNYKDGKNYDPEDGLATEDITDWHIGGDTPDVVPEVEAVLGVVAAYS